MKNYYVPNNAYGIPGGSYSSDEMLLMIRSYQHRQDIVAFLLKQIP